MERIPAYEGKKEYAFISYAHKDSNFVLPLLEKLYEKKYRLWYDEGIRPGSEWPQYIASHLASCDTVVVFVSKNSLESPNCENEVVSAINQNKKIIVFSIDGESHKLLEKYKLCKNGEDFINEFPDRLLGDGSGYDIVIKNKKKLSIWNIIIAFSILLVVLLGAGLYLLETGYFDDYLPGKKIETEITEENKISIDNDILIKAFLDRTGNENLLKNVEFVSERDLNALCDAIGFDAGKNELTYYDLTTNTIKEIYLTYSTDYTMSALTYLPDLEIVHISGANIYSFNDLVNCPKLKTIYLEKDYSYIISNIAIPEERTFEILIEENYE